MPTSTASTALNAPTNLTATSNELSITLSWKDNSQVEDGYKNTGLSANTTYYYKVKAYNSSSTSNYSAVASATTNSSGGSSGNIEMVLVAGGTFQMGSNSGHSDEKPVHSVTVSSFKISKYEITHKQFIEFLNDKGVNANGSYSDATYGNKEYIDMDDGDCAIGHNGSSFYFKGSSYASTDNTPVIEVTWYGANAFCKWAGGRLPTEAEWEYAARGGNQSQGYTYSGSNTIGDVAWYGSNSGSKTHPVGTKQPNELGIYDMSGNVFEWCSDWYSSSYYSSSPSTNPQGPSSGSYRVRRGGGWSTGASGCRTAYRGGGSPGLSYISMGFRLVFSVVQ